MKNREKQKQYKEAYELMKKQKVLSGDYLRKHYTKSLFGYKMYEPLTPRSKDVILTDNYKIPYGNEGRNSMNTIVISSVGTGKTRGFLKSNILQKGCSMVISDVKGDLYNEFAGYLQEEIYGNDKYQIKLIDLRFPEKSNHYNPLKYMHTAEDVIDFAAALAANVSSGTEPFWFHASKNLIASMIFYVFETCPKEKRNLQSVADVYYNYVKAQVDNKNDTGSYRERITSEDNKSLYKEKVYELGQDSFALKYYELADCSDKTWMSVCVTVGQAISLLDVPQIMALTQTDDLELERLGQERVALFINLDDTNNCYDFIAGLLYSQIFKVLYRQASMNEGDKLKQHVRFFMDDFTNYVVPGIVHYIQTCRSKSISIEMLLQSENQLYKIYNDGKGALIGNCAYVYIGSNDLETQQNIATRLGKSVSYVQNNTDKTFVFFPNAPTIIDKKADCENSPLKSYLDNHNKQYTEINLNIPEENRVDYKHLDLWSQEFIDKANINAEKQAQKERLEALKNLYIDIGIIPLKQDCFDSDEERMFWNALINNKEFLNSGIDCEAHRDLRDIFRLNNLTSKEIAEVLNLDTPQFGLSEKKEWDNLKYKLMLMHCDFIFKKDDEIIGILEIDGMQHQNEKEAENDAIKNRVFENAAIKVIRKTAKEVRDNVNKVIEDMLKELLEEADLRKEILDACSPEVIDNENRNENEDNGTNSTETVNLPETKITLPVQETIQREEDDDVIDENRTAVNAILDELKNNKVDE